MRVIYIGVILGKRKRKMETTIRLGLKTSSLQKGMNRMVAWGVYKLQKLTLSPPKMHPPNDAQS